MHSFADGRVTDTGPLNKKRMETVDLEFLDSAQQFIRRAAEDDKPFFVWFNSTRMHFWTHTPEEEEGLSGQGFYNDAMVGHDNLVGRLLDQLDELGIADNTIVFYSTDNGPHFNTWPDAAITPFRSEKNTNWEGGFRVPAMIRWPGKIPAGTILNDMMSFRIVPAGILPGQRIMAGTRNPPSQLVFFSLLKGVMAASGQVLKCGPLSVL